MFVDQNRGHQNPESPTYTRVDLGYKSTVIQAVGDTNPIYVLFMSFSI